MKINETLRKRRIELGLSQREVGEYIKVSQPALCRYENGTNNQNNELITHKLMEFYQGCPKILKLNKTKNDNKNNHHEKIRQKRMELGLSQAEVSKKLGIDPASLCRYELGQSNLTSKNLKKVADFYNINYNFLTGEKKIHETKKENQNNKETPKAIPNKEIKETKIVLPKIEITNNTFTTKLEKLYNEELQKLSKGIEKKAMKKALKKYLKQIRR